MESKSVRNEQIYNPKYGVCDKSDNLVLTIPSAILLSVYMPGRLDTISIRYSYPVPNRLSRKKNHAKAPAHTPDNSHFI